MDSDSEDHRFSVAISRPEAALDLTRGNNPASSGRRRATVSIAGRSVNQTVIADYDVAFHNRSEPIRTGNMCRRMSIVNSRRHDVGEQELLFQLVSLSAPIGHGLNPLRTGFHKRGLHFGTAGIPSRLGRASRKQLPRPGVFMQHFRNFLIDSLIAFSVLSTRSEMASRLYSFHQRGDFCGGPSSQRRGSGLFPRHSFRSS